MFRRPLLNPDALIIALSYVCLLLTSDSIATDSQALLFSQDGYRIAEFRTPVPCSVPGAQTVNTTEVVSLLRKFGDHIVLIDVLPAPPRPKNLAATSLWLPPTRNNLPSTIWLPNVGYGRLSEELTQYFRTNLKTATSGDFNRPIVVYCLADCWMAWNAAKRAVEYGYRQVYWYPEGTTAWEKAGLPVAKSKPVPMTQVPVESVSQ